jgi:hypothetical protein
MTIEEADDERRWRMPSATLTPVATAAAGEVVRYVVEGVGKADALARRGARGRGVVRMPTTLDVEVRQPQNVVNVAREESETQPELRFTRRSTASRAALTPPVPTTSRA